MMLAPGPDSQHECEKYPSETGGVSICDACDLNMVLDFLVFVLVPTIVMEMPLKVFSAVGLGVKVTAGLNSD